MTLIISIKPVSGSDTKQYFVSPTQMDEIQTANAKSTEAVSSAKAEIGAAKKELQGLGIELQGLLTQVSLQYMSIHIK